MFPDDMRFYPTGSRLLATGDKGGFNWPQPKERALLANGGTVPVRVVDNDEVAMHGGYTVMVTTASGHEYATWIGHQDLVPSHEPVDVKDSEIFDLIEQTAAVLERAGIEDQSEFISLLRQKSVTGLLGAVTLAMNQVRLLPDAPHISQWKKLDGLWSHAAAMVDAAVLLQNTWNIAGTSTCPRDTQAKVAEAMERVMADLAPQTSRWFAPEPPVGATR